MEAIGDAVPKLTNTLVAKYVLSRYMLLYFVREILKKDDMWNEINTNPKTFVRSKQAREHFRHCIDNILVDLITDVNAEIEGVEQNFDYRGKLRSAEWVKALGRSVVGDHLKLVGRKKIPSFSDDWRSNPVMAKGA